jgi:hypothetical protein
MTILQKIGFVRLQVGSQNVYIVAANQYTVTALCDIKSMPISLGFSLLYANWIGHLIPYMHTEQFPLSLED